MTAWRSASTSERTRAALMGAALCLVLLAPATAHAAWSDMEGRIALGYAKLFSSGETPGGSLSVSGGLDLPVTERWRGGFTIGFSLLGSTNESRGSLFANVDYTAFEALAQAQWLPAAGPVARVGIGAGLMSARAEIASAGGGARFRDLAREEVAPALGLDATLMSSKPAPVRVGLQLGSRFGFLPQETWTILLARVAFHY